MSMNSTWLPPWFEIGWVAVYAVVFLAHLRHTSEPEGALAVAVRTGTSSGHGYGRELRVTLAAMTPGMAYMFLAMQYGLPDPGMGGM